MPFVVIAAVVIAAASIALSIKQGQDTKKAAKKQRDLEQRRLNIEKQQRSLVQQRNEARLRKQARTKTSALINNAFGAGIRFSSSFAGASAAISANQRGALSFSQQSAGLAGLADDITAEQINLNAQTQITNATNQQIGGVIEGLGSIVSAVGGAGGGGGQGATTFGGS